MATNMLAERQTTAVAAREPLTIDDLLKRGELLIDSGLAPESIKTAAQAAIIMLTGQELGLQPMQALSDIYVVNGRPSLGTKLMCALYKRAGHSYQIKERTPERVTVLFTLRDGSTYSHTVTMAEAEQAKWPYNWDSKASQWKPKHTWKGMPTVMLTYRCLSTGIRTIAPEILNGMLHQDEAEDGAGPESETAQADDVVDSTARVVEDPEPEGDPGDATPPTAGPHWTENMDLTGQFLMIKKELGLNAGEMFAALRQGNNATIERVGQYPGTYDQAVRALKTYAKEKADEEGRLI